MTKHDVKRQGYMKACIPTCPSLNTTLTLTFRDQFRCAKHERDFKAKTKRLKALRDCLSQTAALAAPPPPLGALADTAQDGRSWPHKTSSLIEVTAESARHLSIR